MANDATIYRFDCDSTGTDSIEEYVSSGRIKNIECPTFDAFDTAARGLTETIKEGDFFILDTLSILLDTTRGDLTHGTDPSRSLWEDASKYYGDKGYLNTYKAAQNLTLRRVRNLLNRKARGIILCQESEGKDPQQTIGKLAIPMMNPAMVDDFLGICTDVFRLEVITSDEFNADGQKVLSVGQRVLRLRRSDEWTAKFHVDPTKRDPFAVPNALVGAVPKPGAKIRPTMADIWNTLGKIPKNICIYGVPGVGKSTLGASVVDAILNNPLLTNNQQPELVKAK